LLNIEEFVKKLNSINDDKNKVNEDLKSDLVASEDII
jgi:hypothetical protein